MLLLQVLLIAGITLVVFIIIGAATWWKLAAIAVDYTRLKEENIKLIKSLQQIDKLKEELARVQNYEKQLRGSLNGYVKIENTSSAEQVADRDELDINKLTLEKHRTIFNTIPSIAPAEGFIGRGFETSTLRTDAHLGIDISAPSGTPVVSVADGVVIFSGFTDDGGNTIIIEHGYGFITVYKHNQMNLVGEVEQVQKGQLIGLLGNTGKMTSGPHVHFEIWRNSLPVDPANYITK